MLLVVAKMTTTVRDVRKQILGLYVWIEQPPTRNMNVSGPDMGYIDTVVVPFQITVWVAKHGFGKPVPNALLGKAHNRIDATASVSS